MVTDPQSMPEAHNNAVRRVTAAKWLSSLSNTAVPTESDLAFRGALRDGKILCDAIQAIHPGILTKAANGSRPALDSDVHSFLAAWTFLKLPVEVCFSLEDLLSLEDERLQVVEAVLTLKHRLDNVGTIPAHHPATMENDTAFHADDIGSQSAKMAAAAQNKVGVTRLMMQCTSMLREKMWKENARAPPPALRYRDSNGREDNALEAMGPVLESVLGSLTQEYERRLLQKDTELKTLADQLRRTQEHVGLLEQQVSAHAGQPQIEYQMTDEQKLEYERLTSMEESYKAQLEGGQHERAVITAEFERVRRDNARLELTCKDYQEQILAGEAILNSYKAMKDENRKLYNLVQDLRGNIRVFCRIRPTGVTGDTAASCVQVGDDGQIAVYNPTSGRRAMYAYDRIFSEASSQEEVYLETQPLIRSVMDGYNVCIFAYGQTGSGKTHTMSGTDVETHAGRGINYRALDDLFDLKHQRKPETRYDIRVQMLEVYNEQVRDLLAEDRDVRLEIQNTQRSGTNVPDAIQVDVASTQDVLDVMETGQRNRATAGTKMNERSSRSHSVLTVVVHGFNTVTEQVTHACLHLIDLAGSERVGKSEAEGDRLAEAKCINKSLSAIGDVMAALATKSKHVPFRNSKLTQLLSDSLSGQAKVMMFMHIAPEATSHGESVSTLKFGSRVSEITLGQAKRNVEAGSTLEAREAQRELQGRVSQLSSDLDRERASSAAQQAEAERARAAERTAVEQARSEGARVAALEAEIAAMREAIAKQDSGAMAGRSDSATSTGSAGAGIGSGLKPIGTTARASLRRSGLPESPSTAGSQGSSQLTAEQKHIQRMRVKAKASRPSTAPPRALGKR